MKISVIIIINMIFPVALTRPKIFCNNKLNEFCMLLIILVLSGTRFNKKSGVIDFKFSVSKLKILANSCWRSFTEKSFIWILKFVIKTPRNQIIKNIVEPIIERTLKALLFIRLSKTSTLGKKIEVSINDKIKIIKMGEINGIIIHNNPSITKVSNRRYIFSNGSISLIFPSKFYLTLLVVRLVL